MGLNFAGISNETMTLPDNAFQGGFWVTDKKSTNTDGGSFSSGGWRQRDFNEVEFKFGIQPQNKDSLFVKIGDIIQNQSTYTVDYRLKKD